MHAFVINPSVLAFRLNAMKPLMGVFLINISLLNSLWVSVMQRFIFPGLFICFSLCLLAFLMISFACIVQMVVSFVWSCRLNFCLNLLLCFEFECAFFTVS